MKGRLFLIHWHQMEAQLLADPLRKLGWEVEIEAEDGARGGKQILANPPDAVLIYLTRLPSHGRETAQYVRSTKTGRNIPILFINGDEEKVAKVRANLPDAIYCTSGELYRNLKRFSNKAPHA